MLKEIPMGRKSIVMVEPCEFAEASPCRENMVASGAYCKTLPRHEQESHHYGGLSSFVQETRWFVMYPSLVTLKKLKFHLQ